MSSIVLVARMIFFAAKLYKTIRLHRQQRCSDANLVLRPNVRQVLDQIGEHVPVPVQRAPDDKLRAVDVDQRSDDADRFDVVDNASVSQ